MAGKHQRTLWMASIAAIRDREVFSVGEPRGSPTEKYHRSPGRLQWKQPYGPHDR